MKLVILGASGRVGRWATTIATNTGHSVTVALRPAGQFDPVDGVTISRGDLTDPGFLESVVTGHDAVVSCVGLRRSGLSPFAKLLSPPDLTTRLASTLARAMDNQHVRRLIVLSAGGVGDSFPLLTWPVQQLVQTGNVAVAYRDLAGMEARLSASSLDWLAVRPVTLMNGVLLGRARPVHRYGLTSIIRRADVAAWMIKSATQHDSFIEHTVLLGS